MYEAYKKPNLVHSFKKAPKLIMEFHYPISGDELDLEYFMNNDPTLLETKIRQLALLFEETNLVTDEGKPVMLKTDILPLKCGVFANMPIGMLEELHEALIKYYPEWKVVD
jgi:hypothetical protein